MADEGVSVIEKGSEKGQGKTERIIETLEIDEPIRTATDVPTLVTNDEEIGNDLDDDDLKELLPASSHRPEPKKPRCSSCCTPCEKVGRMTIFLPRVYYATGWGIQGPHWFGPPCVLGVIILATIHLVNDTWIERPYTAVICTIFSLVCSYHLFNAAYRDPGLIRAKISGEEAGRDYCWCDFCNNYQPPGGAHCAQCNVCIAGYDHHCVWMGLCIGRNNFRQFIRFNLSWLAYLGYALVWVKVVGAISLSYDHHNDDES
ncbi:hypothetical protein FisN_36Lh048 [Fistulifera solaris]|uniref:Palmitoyltransferase n=1 Tax=Fistulifera solaris TaxID=1519565 RepID=A0A1Z5JHK9_FISSO|nr:hypothetical protein FisN_36Lh048 [Fistulifera solaris]|eukprot:GAX13493.1 hypothetical protein FisN_36Lh048 [Fistulifera solaris]